MFFSGGGGESRVCAGRAKGEEIEHAGLTGAFGQEISQVLMCSFYIRKKVIWARSCELSLFPSPCHGTLLPL